MRRLPQNEIVVPSRTARRFYGHGIPRVDVEKLAGRLIVVEGADGSGRSTQIAMLVEWLEGTGHATVQVGLKRSTLVSEELERAQEGNILSRTVAARDVLDDSGTLRQLTTTFGASSDGYFLETEQNPAGHVATANHSQAWGAPVFEQKVQNGPTTSTTFDALVLKQRR